MRLRPLAATAATLLGLTLVWPAPAASAAPTPPTTENATTTATANATATAINPGTRRVTVPTLTARATLSADYSAPGPDSGAQATPDNGRTGPFEGQVIPGFSGVVANGDGTYWAMPDNGFGAKTNSADFRLRLYLVKPAWETATGGAGRIKIQRFVSLRDPDNKINFPIVNEDTRARLLTGADFDIESVVRDPDGSFWIGEEFGPYLLHVDRRGRVLQAPVPFPGGKSPQNPTLAEGEQPNVPRSRGFEAMAGSPDGRYLYPVVEGALIDDPNLRRRLVYEFDTTRTRYTGRTWAYQTDTDANLVGDAHWAGRNKLVILERDDFEGAASVVKRVYTVTLSRTDGEGFARKTLLIDLLDIDNPDEIGVQSSPGAYGVGRQFSFPFQSVETIVPLGRNRYLLANDNNFPGNDARYPGRPDDTEMIILTLGRQRVLDTGIPLVAHRGASGYRPEHTLAAYQLAISQGADSIEPDVVSTSDGVLVARHEPQIGMTTDVARRSEFADRRTTKVIDGVTVADEWFVEDFTLAELRTLRAVERLPLVRGANTAFDGLYVIPTLDEVVDFARRSRTAGGRPVGVHPETKHPTYYASIGLALEDPLLEVLESDGYGERGAPVVIQSFETANLRALSRRTDLPLSQLVNCSGAPYDLLSSGDPRTYADLVTPDGLDDIAGYADDLGLCKDVMIPRDASGLLLAPTPVIADAHAAGLSVTGWTFRRENQFLPTQFRVGSDPAAVGNLKGEIQAFLAAGMDAFFTDNPDVGDLARREFVLDEDRAATAAATVVSG